MTAHSKHPAGSGQIEAGQGTLEGRYASVRSTTLWLAEPLETEDYCIQTMPEVSPTKWHIAHTSWFFETFVLAADPDYVPFHPQYTVLFNSYYQAVGPQYFRPHRGLLSRPTVAEVLRYRTHVDEHMNNAFSRGLSDTLAEIVTTGLHHEQQHQELLLTDIKHVFSCNPLRPTYVPGSPPSTTTPAPLHWVDFPGGLRSIGHGGEAFAFDNERPRHRVFLQPFRLASRAVTCGEYIEFMADRGYSRPELWLADGWDAIQRGSWEAPLYWERRDETWWHLTLHGMQPVRLEAPVCHVSQFEADAYANWTGFRLPTEAEWETATEGLDVGGNLLESQELHPLPAQTGDGPVQTFGDVWEWTQSPYTPYPGYRAPSGALGEYNGKFMSGQMVLRGGSCATPRSHIRATYRNFFQPHHRWQFSGIRLAKDL